MTDHTSAQPGTIGPDPTGDADSGARGGSAARRGTVSGVDPFARPSWTERRRTKIAAEIAKNRRGEYKVPTWVLSVLLAIIVLGWLAMIFLN